ncbi:MAG TPA: KEOPS complex subunit Cgi121 [archaeon]|nr:KEOPS complex subunit Cgi121 [archaeon]
MFKEIREFKKWLVIAGFKNVEVEDVDAVFSKIRKETKVSVQIFNSDSIAGWRHIYFATLNALKSFHDASNISSNLAVETLLYASGVRQIKRSVEALGIKTTSRRLAVLIIADNKADAAETLSIISKIVGGKQDDDVLEIKTADKYASIKKTFNISNYEIEAETEKAGLERKALTDLIIERGAILTVGH